MLTLCTFSSFDLLLFAINTSEDAKGLKCGKISQPELLHFSKRMNQLLRLEACSTEAVTQTEHKSKRDEVCERYRKCKSWAKISVRAFSQGRRQQVWRTDPNMATNPKLQRLSYERVYLKVTPSSSRNNRFNCYCREKRKCRSVQRLTHESTTRLSFHHEASPCTARPSLCASISQRRWTEEKWGRGAKLKQKEERAGCLEVWTTWPTCLYSHEITYDGMTALFVFWPSRGAPIKALTLWNVQKCRETQTSCSC